MATVFPNPSFNPEQTCKDLRKAMKGFGTDEDKIIKILASHSNSQRQNLSSQFKNMFGRDLVSDLKSELGGKFEDLAIALMDPFPLYLAKELRKAMKGLGTDEGSLIEIICPRPNNEIRAIKAHYQNEFQRDLEEDLKSEVGGDFENMLVSLVQASRDESNYVDNAKADQDAQALLEAGVNQWGTDEAVFNAIFCTRSFPHLRETFQRYKSLSGKDIIDTIQSELTGTLESGFKALAKYTMDPHMYFAERLHKCMSGLGTDDASLIRLIVSRSEFDLKDVSGAFSGSYGKTLRDFIEGDCGGDYCKLLLALLGNN